MIYLLWSISDYNAFYDVFLQWLIQFPKLCGMTGTAATESAEFESIYKLKVTIVPTNKPMIRKVLFYACLPIKKLM